MTTDAEFCRGGQVVLPVVNKEHLLPAQTQTLQKERIDGWIRLADTNIAREDDRIEPALPVFHLAQSRHPLPGSVGQDAEPQGRGEIADQLPGLRYRPHVID